MHKKKYLPTFDNQNLVMTPIRIFEKWLQEELALTTVRVPTACCLSTTGTDGFPNARFVSLKEVVDDNFVITGPLSSRKGVEIRNSCKVALTFWWPATERQVRIQGTASEISAQLADKYFSERNKESKIVSAVSRQGREMADMSPLVQEYERLRRLDTTVNRPDDWGGYSISPVRIELMEFRATRFHQRNLYELSNGTWIEKQLQP